MVEISWLLTVLLVQEPRMIERGDLDRPAPGVFVDRADFLRFLPELVCQLQVPASIEFGLLEMPQSPDVKEWTTRDVFFDEYPRPDTKRMVGPFESRRGSLREVLDGACKSSMDLSWELMNGRINIFRGPRQKSKLADMMELTIEGFEESGDFMEVAFGLKAHIEGAFPGLKPGPQFKDDPLNRPNMLLDPRMKLDFKASVTAGRKTLRTTLHEMIQDQPTVMWMSFYAPKGTYYGNIDGCIFVPTRWSPQRAKFTEEELFRGADPSYGDLHGYRDVETRVNDCRREIKRRLRLRRDEVLAALRRLDVIAKATSQPDLDIGIDIMRFLAEIRDKEVTEQLIGAVLQMKVGERRFRFVQMCFPELGLYGFGDTYLRLWERLSKEDADPAVRRYAGSVVEGYREDRKRDGK